MKKIAASVVATLVVLAFFTQMGWLEIVGIHRVSVFTDKNSSDQSEKADKYTYVTQGSVKYRVKAEGDYFYIYNDGKWNKTFLKGVNIGASEPGMFPGELNISYESYLRWFEYISSMNANCVRVYTTMRPQFYKALYDFNLKAENPLYLLHGVWMDEDDITALSDVYAENQKIYNEFKQDALDLVDVVHGNITLPERSGFASGTYTADVSKWVIGFIIGIEWDPKFVLNTNKQNQDKKDYDGTYLYTQGTTPFEAFLADVGDSVIKYQTTKYKFQVPVAFSNWVTTDPISHPDEPHEDEDLISVNMENIKSRSAFYPNMFISYHIYPYYPDSLNYQRDYLKYIDSSGKVNTYEAYLKDLKMAHTLPVLVAEFGVPTSRGMGHENVMGYNQGHIDETEQGKILIDLLNSIHKQKYAGGLMFTWQDEWFKRTWNNQNFDIADSRPYWSNIQTSEQCFGILAFDPGEKGVISHVDGDVSEWSKSSRIGTNSLGDIYAKSDERYLYLMIKLKEDYDFEKDTLLIPIDTIEHQGNKFISGTNVKFGRYADFLISINGKNNSRITVDSYYDSFYYLYGEQYKMMKIVNDIRKINSGRFNKMLMCYGYEMEIPTTKKKIPFKSFETGKLKFGNSHPKSPDYKSLSDFYYADGKLEIRIPWQLLNVMDPSSKKIMDDFYSQQSITARDFTDFKLGFGIQGKTKNISMDFTYSYKKWKTPTFHERLKPAYYELQEALKDFN